MNRRGFIGALVGGVATAAAVRTWPFRVYSFPTEVETVSPYLQCVALQLEQVRKHIPVMYENDQVFLTAFEQEGRLGLGSGAVWEKDFLGLPRQKYPVAVVTDVDQVNRTITLASPLPRNFARRLRGY